PEGRGQGDEAIEVGEHLGVDARVAFEGPGHPPRADEPPLRVHHEAQAVPGRRPVREEVLQELAEVLGEVPRSRAQRERVVLEGVDLPRPRRLEGREVGEQRLG
ncbi:hypothetical protein RZS08_62955, partial [Arthrospira platensis SPKY1]|nr:hypothetical protein [Arthrospira platensis SPKY1]